MGVMVPHLCQWSASPGLVLPKHQPSDLNCASSAARFWQARSILSCGSPRVVQVTSAEIQIERSFSGSVAGGGTLPDTPLIVVKRNSNCGGSNEPLVVILADIRAQAGGLAPDAFDPK